MKHLITGGSGFLGNLIMKRLLEIGEEVKVLDIWKSKDHPKDVEFINCDIRDSEKVVKSMKDIDIVHHNVALVPLTKSGKKFWDVNVIGSKIAAESAQKAGVDGFIHMSSSALYGAVNNFPITDKTPTSPIEIYGEAKLAGENVVSSIFKNTNIPLIIIRPRTILGEGRLGIFQILFEWIKENKNVYVIGDGKVKFQFVHAMDLMDFYMLALNKGKNGKYNVGTNKFGQLRSCLENIIKYANSKSKVKSLPVFITINALKFADILNLSPLAPWHYLTYHKEFYFEIEPLIKLGWKPKYSNDDMFKESYDWFISNYGNWSLNQEGSAHRKPVKEALLKFVKFIS